MYDRHITSHIKMFLDCLTFQDGLNVNYLIYSLV